MASEIYTVRCKPTSAAQLKTTLWKAGAQVTQEIIVKGPTDFELRADYTNSDGSVQGFKLRIAPTTTPDIVKIVGQDTAVLFFTDLCTQRADITLNLTALGPGGPFPMGPRPIIRNEPTRPLNPLKVLAYTALALLAALVVFMVIRNYLG